jgi:DNA-binding NarL/FixJ family response regulator
VDLPAKILVVDDVPANIEMLEGLLTAHGFAVAAATSGLEALRSVEIEVPSLVLLDILMPEMDGYEVCRRLRENPVSRLLPVVMITASGEEEKVRAIECGADDFIVKPLNRAELFARIRSLLRIKTYQDTVQAQAAKLAEWNDLLQARVQQQMSEVERLERLRRFLSPQIAELVIAEGEEQLESHRREIVALRAQLRGFAGLTESSDPEWVLEVLRVFHAAVGKLIFNSQGTLTHFTAGGLMVIFNDPVPCEDAAERAVRLATEMHWCIGELQPAWRRVGLELGLGVGIAMGYATLGRIGFEGRYDYGAIGPVTMLADHLCAEAGTGQTLVSQRLYGAIREIVDGDAAGDILPREFLRPVTAFDVRGLKENGSPARAALSTREREVVALVARGFTNRQIAQQLLVTEATAAKHLENILGKLSFTSRAQVAAWAVGQGLATGPS